MHPILRSVAAAAAIALTATAPCAAEDVLLTVQHPDGRETALTLDQLAEMGATEIATTTPWTEGEQQFVGVSGGDLVAALGIQAETVFAHAVNDYDVAIPFAEFAQDTTLIAYSRNGSPMSVRDKGPLWVVFPFDGDPRFAADLYSAYAIWNLASVRFE